MYVVTFYSHKGGVGRTQALTNIAYLLAQSGRRVLIVDFDLEAPGLDTINLADNSESSSKGVVEYVQEYMDTGIAPKVEDFVYEPWGEQGAGSLFVMPAGLVNDDYGARFNAIDWESLYENQDGFLLFEDLKAQWNESFKPDYVLIDSRTGHTDVSGICTRQLADAVVLMFFPNKQNLRGISKVARDISQHQVPRENKIKTHVVMSNVPDLDDENSVFERFRSQLDDELELDGDPSVINHYPSWDFLDEGLFVESHPNSRLTKQYWELANTIKSSNLEDPEGAIAFLEIQNRGIRNHEFRFQDLEDNVRKITAMHEADVNVLTRAAKAWETIGQYSEAFIAYDMAESAGSANPSTWLAKARCSVELGKTNLAKKAISKVLESSESTSLVVRKAISLILRNDNEQLDSVSDSAAMKSVQVDDRYWIASQLFESPHGISSGIKILEELEQSDLAEPFDRIVPHTLALQLIGQRRFTEALERLPSIQDDGMSISNSFNVGMATWGVTSECPVELFSKVIAMHEQSESNIDDANYLQCISLAYAAVGKYADAIENGDCCRKMLLKGLRNTFSSWRYCEVDTSVFLDDLEEMKKQFRKEQCNPLVFTAINND